MYCDQYEFCPDQAVFSCRNQDQCPSLPSCFHISEEHHIRRVRIHAMERAKLVGIPALQSYYVMTAVSELANNLVFHTKDGGILRFYRVEKGGRSGIEIIVQDKGPGIACVANAMQDGFSSNGGLGAGLGGAQRLMDEFEIESELGIGTRITVRKWVPR